MFKVRLATWVVAVIGRAFWVAIVGGTITFLFFRNREPIPGIIALAVTLGLVLALVATRTLSLARAFAAAEAKQAERAPRAPQSTRPS